MTWLPFTLQGRGSPAIGGRVPFDILAPQADTETAFGMDDFTLPDVEEGIPGVLKLLRLLTNESRRQGNAIHELQREMQKQSDGQTTLERVLRGDEWGKNSLIFQVAGVERMQHEQGQTLGEIKQLVEQIQKADISGRTSIIEKIIVAVIGAVAAITVALITGLLKIHG